MLFSKARLVLAIVTLLQAHYLVASSTAAFSSLSNVIVVSVWHFDCGLAVLLMATESGSQEALLDAIKRLEDRMDKQMTKMKRELVQEREQADERLVKRMKLEKAATLETNRSTHGVVYFHEGSARSLHSELTEHSVIMHFMNALCNVALAWDVFSSVFFPL